MLESLPAYVSRGRVQAARIADIHGTDPDGGVNLVLEMPDGARLREKVGPKVFARGMASVGDFVVRYDDGYVSWSPKKAFEEGYRPAFKPEATNVYEGGKGDERQGDAPALKPEHSLFRKRYRKLEPAEVALHDAIKDKADELAALIAQVKTTPATNPSPPMRGTAEALLENVANNPGANVTLALRHVEDAVYRAVKALTA